MIRNKKGFTLIELIIVMAIIGILAVVAVIAIGSKSADARDARRLADMASVRTALALSCSESEVIDITNGSSDVLIQVCDASGSSYMTFTNIHDPGDDGANCTAEADDTVLCTATGQSGCDYAFGLPATGAVFDMSAGVDVVDACDYRINFFQEDSSKAGGYASDAGLVE